MDAIVVTPYHSRLCCTRRAVRCGTAPPCREVASSTVARVLRDVVESDIDAFYEHQREPEATEMALFPARDREAFEAHWRRLLADNSSIKKTIVHDGQVAGNIGCWDQDGRRLIGYWIGKEFWGRGLATRALSEFVEDLPRPLHAWVVSSNVGSIRVLEKCGFVPVGSHTEHNASLDRVVEEVLYELA
jgi:RimJ/RimL family protein N-acetyltransferase